MSTLSSLLGGRWSHRRAGLIAVIIVTALVPAALLLTLAPSPTDTGIRAAIVNLDQPITDTATPVAAGKLLTENLVSTPGGFDWTLTDADAASAGLADGTYVAVVTVPADFSQTTTTLGTSTPEQATISVQTAQAHGYLAGSVATALSQSLPTGTAAQLTSGFVGGTLSAFAKLGQGLGTASSAAGQIAGGTSEAAAGAAQLSAGNAELGSGLSTMSGILGAMPQGARDLGALTDAGAQASGALAGRLLERSGATLDLSLRQDVASAELAALEALVLDDPSLTPDEIAAAIAAVRADLDGIAGELGTESGALAGDAVDAGVIAIGAGVIAEVSGPVADGLGGLAIAMDGAAAGAQTLADAEGQLSSGLGTLASGGASLASGLSEIQSQIPQYTDAQQQEIAKVVASPIGVDAASVAGPPSAWTASLAALAPIALWIGALVVFLFVAPFSRAALATPASVWRIAGRAGAVAVLLAVVQAVPLALILVVSGAAGDRILVASAFVVGVSIVFAVLHQGLVAAFGRVGLVVSLVALGVQVVAAGTVVPGASGPLSLLPLSLALQGMQALFGGALHAVLAAAVGLVIWGVLAVLLTVVGVSRARRAALHRFAPTPA